MITEKIRIGAIPALVWGNASDKAYIHVHGKMSRKEYAENVAVIAAEKGMQVLSFDLPEHGERTDDARCDVFDGVRELRQVAEYAFSRWKHVSLFGCSLGAYFALNACRDMPLQKCLFQSPIVDMEWLVKHMMLWSGVDEERLQREKEISTPIDLLRWDYYQYIIAHPVAEWPHATHILYGAKDDLQPMDSLRTFAQRFGASLTVSENSMHPFMEETDRPVVDKWLRETL